jgi:hypothetical protein
MWHYKDINAFHIMRDIPYLRYSTTVYAIEEVYQRIGHTSIRTPLKSMLKGS